MGKIIDRILIVEDEEALLFGLKKLLEGSALTVHTAGSLASAGNLLRLNEYKALITDLRLSGTSVQEGLEVIAQARRLQPECRIIAITAFAADETQNRVKALGVDSFLEKPVSPDKLRKILSTLRGFNG